MDLIADIGATNTRCALLDDRGDVVATEHFVNSEFADLGSLLTAYLQRRQDSDQPRDAALAIAAPVHDDEVRMININWSFSQASLREQLRLSRLLMCNDFEAIARGLPDLVRDDLQQVGAGLEAARATKVVLGPGSGLGVAGLVPGAETWTVASGEGGHVTMAPIDDEEAQILKLMRETVGHCSAERLLSGPGLVNLYWAVGQLHGVEADKVQPEQVMTLADQGDPLALSARQHFFAMLGTIAGNLALTMGARGGVYIAGGIVPDCVEQFRESKFRERFESKGRYRRYLQEIPSYVITRPEPAFVGLRRFLGYC